MGYGAIVFSPQRLKAAWALTLFLAASVSFAADPSKKQLRMPKPAARDASVEEPIAPPMSPSQPDPTPLVARTFWMFDLYYDDGELLAGPTYILDKGSPEASPRVMGRFAIELYEGEELIERVRFDFPLLGVTPSSPKERHGTNVRIKTRIGVLFPVTKRGTRLELQDRALDRRWSLPWPEAMPGGNTSPH